MRHSGSILGQSDRIRLFGSLNRPPSNTGNMSIQGQLRCSTEVLLKLAIIADLGLLVGLGYLDSGCDIYAA